MLIATAKTQGRYGIRDSLLILMTYRHAFRVGEVVDLKWDQVDMDNAKLYVNRLKNGDSSVHYLEGDELRALRKLKRDSATSAFVFCSERNGPLTTSSVHKLVARTGKLAGMEFPIHPHMLRHAKGYQLASKGVDTRAIQAYFGHKNIQHTVLYTKLDPSRSRGSAKISKVELSAKQCHGGISDLNWVVNELQSHRTAKEMAYETQRLKISERSEATQQG